VLRNIRIIFEIHLVPEELVLEASEGRVKEKWPAQLNKLVWDGGHDLVLSIGQVVPHEGAFEYEYESSGS